MAILKTNDWSRVDLTLKSLQDGTTTRTYSFINKELVNSQIESYYPILEEVSELGVQMGLILPQPEGGTFRIRNSPGTFGANRKFSDLFERFTPIAQEVTVYSFRTDIDDNDPVAGDFVQEWKGVVEAVQSPIGPDGATLEFVIKPELFEDKIVTPVLVASRVPDAPAQSLGKVMPIVISPADVYVDCVCVPISAESDTTPSYAYSEGVSIGHSAHAYILCMQNTEGEWVELGNERSPATGSTKAIDGSGVTVTSSFSLNAGPRAWEIGAALTEAFLVDAGRVSMKGNGLAASTAKMTVELWELDRNSYAFQVAKAQAQVDLSQYDASNAALTAAINVDFSFDRPVVCDWTKYRYAMAFLVTGWQAGEMSLNYGAGTDNMWLKVNDGNNSFATEYAEQTANTTSTISLFGPEYHSGVYISSAGTDLSKNPNGEVDYDGLGFHELTLSRDYSAGAGQTHPSLARLNIIAKVAWETDTSMVDVLPLNTSHWDKNYLSTERNALIVAGGGARTRHGCGATQGRMSLLQVIEEMCRNLCCRVGQRNNGKWFFWPWGFEHEVAAVIPPEDITPITYHIEDKTSVINRVKIAYARSVRNLNLERGAQQGEFSNYESTLEWDADTNTKTALLSAVSEALYGRRELEFNACNFLATEREAETFAEYHMARFDKPSTYVNFIVPYEPYENLELLQVIKAAHPAWPAFYGTNPSDKEPIWEDPSDPADTGPSDLKQGFYWTRAKTYRMQIEGRFRRPGVGEPSSLRLVCRLLLNYPKDPT